MLSSSALPKRSNESQRAFSWKSRAFFWGPLGPAKRASGTWRKKSYTQQSGGGLGVRVQIGPQGAAGREMGT